MRVILSPFIYALCTFALSVNSQAFGARFASVIDMSNPVNAQVLKYLGGSTNDTFGVSAASGDINGDGYKDFVVGAPSSLSGRGTTYVQFGGPTIFSVASKDMYYAYTGILKIYGDKILDWSGYSVAVGNINGDAYDDIIIGAYRADPLNRLNAGVVYVIFGSATLHTVQQINLNTNPSGIVKIYGKSAEDYTGFSVSIGKINEDNYGDLIIGAYQADTPGKTDSGVTYIIFGSSTFKNLGTIDLNDPPSGVAKIYGENAQDNLGYSVGSGNFNGDAYKDVLIGAYNSYNGHGGTYIIHGSADIDTCTVIDLYTLPIGMVRIYGETEGDHSGAAVASGDLNGDGFSDVIMGAPSSDPDGRIDAGAVNVIFGDANFKNKGALLLDTVTTGKLKVIGKDMSGVLGSAVTAGDLNGDGRDELIIGAPSAAPLSRFNAGTVYVVSGASDIAQRGTIDLNASPSKVSRIYGAAAGDKLGYTLTAADMNGDGFKDIFAGAAFAAPLERSNAGTGYLVKGFSTTQVISFSPGNATYASKYSTIGMNFNSDIDTLTVDVFSTQVGVVNGLLSRTVNAATFTPTNPLNPTSQITVIANGKNTDNESVTTKQWFFYVKDNETPPGFKSHTPAALEKNVAPTQNIVVSFTSDIKPDSTFVSISGNKHSAAISMVKSWTDSTLTLVNNNSFSLNETITVVISAADQYGDRADSTWTFTVRPEIIPPMYTLRIPGPRQLLKKNSYIQLFFPLDIDKESVTTSLEGSLSGSISGNWVWADTVYTFTPTQNYQPGESLSLVVSASDIHKNTIATNEVFAVRLDEVPPSIVSRTPASNEHDVSITAHIVIEFSTDVNRDSTTVTVYSPIQGNKSYTRSWIDYTLTLSGMTFLGSDTITVTVNTGDAYANRQVYQWVFYTRTDLTPPYFTVQVPQRITAMGTQDTITLVFPADIDTLRVYTTLLGSLNDTIPGSWTWSDTRYTFAPQNAYPLGYKLYLTVNATDIHNNTLPDTTVVFTVKTDEISPRVKSHTPPAFALNVARNTSVVINFTDDISSQLSSNVIFSNLRTSIPFSKVWTDSTLTITFPSQLQQNETVTVSVTAVDSNYNERLYEWSFSTGSALTLSYFTITSPLNQNNMGRSEPLKIAFNNKVDLATVSKTLTGSISGAINGTWSWSGLTYTFTPSVSYAFGETLSLTVNAKDIYGNQIPPGVFTFRIKADDTTPAILSRSPLNGAQNILPSANITAGFTDDAVPDSTTVTVTGSIQGTIAVTKSWSGKTLTLLHSNSFRLGEVITVLVKTSDIYANRLEESWSFTVRPELDPPYFEVVTSHGMNQMRTKDAISLVFPNDVNRDKVTVSLVGSLSGSVPGEWAWSDSTITFTPIGYKPGETLTLTVNAVDIHENAIPETTRTFRVKLTDESPEVVSTVPPRNQTLVMPDTGIVIQFTGSIESDSTKVIVRGEKQGTVSMIPTWSDSVLTLSNPGSFTRGDTILVTVNGGDIWGNRFTDSWEFSIRPETEPPYYELSVQQKDSAIPMNAVFTFQFPADVDTSRVNVALTGSISGPIEARRTWENTVYTVTPLKLLTPDQTLTIMVNAADINDNILPEKKHVFTVIKNQGPLLTITGIILYNLQNYTYRIHYTVEDPDGSYTTATGWQYSLDGAGWVDIPGNAITGNSPQAPGNRFIYLTLPSSFKGVFSENVRIRMQVSDGLFLSVHQVSPVFKVDWNMAPAVTLTDAHVDYLTNRSIISYTVSDLEHNAVSLVFEYSLDGGFTWIAGTTDTDLSSLAPARYTGSFAWDFNAGLKPGNDYTDVRVRLTPSDYKTGVSSVSKPYRIDLNAPPSVTVGNVPSPQTKNVSITYHIADAENDTIRFVCSYSTNSGVNWSQTTHVSDADSITIYDGAVIWHSWMDLPVINAGDIRFRLEPWDNDKGTDDITNTFSLVNNGSPSVAVSLPDTVGNVVVIPFTISDTEKDPVSIHVRWSVDGQQWHPATVTGDTLDLSGAAYSGSLKWLSAADTGKGFFDAAYLRIYATDPSNPPDSPAVKYAEEVFRLDNESPHVVSVYGFAEKDTLYVRFSEPVVLDNALNVANYALSPSLSIKSVLSGKSSDTFIEYDVALEKGQTLPWTECSLTIINMEDVFGNIADQSVSFLPDDGSAPPSVTLQPLPDTVTGLVIMNYTISDLEHNTVTLLVSFSQDGGKTWNDGTFIGDLTNITVENYVGAFIWNTTVDIPGREVDNIVVRVIPRDTKEGVPAVTEPFTVDNNYLPSIKLSIPVPDSLYYGTMPVSFVLSDLEEDVVSLEATFSFDGGATYSPATVSGKLTGIEPDGYQGTLQWNTSIDFPKKYGQLIFKVLPSDTDAGAADSLFIWIDNFGISKVSITLPEGEQTGSIPVGYRIINTVGNAVALAVTYSGDGGATWNAATIESVDHDLSAITSGNYSGTFTWQAPIDIPGKEGSFLVKVLPNNGTDGVADSSMVYVDFNSPPFVTISAVEGEVSGDMPLSFTVSDAEKDVVSISLSYSIDGRKTWHEADIGGETGNITADGSNRTVIWHSGNDLPNRELDMVWLRMTARDYDSGEASETGPINLDNNQPPAITLTVSNTDSVFTAAVDISYTLEDAEDDTLSITLFYSIDGGSEFKTPHITGMLTGITSMNYSGTLYWDLNQDLPDFFGDVLVKLVPSDNDEGIPGTLNLRVNTHGVCSVTADFIDTGDSTITVSYIITDQKQYPVSLKVDYSTDKGATYKPATVSGQLIDIPSSQYTGSFLWKSIADLDRYDGNVLVRITPNNGYDGLALTKSIDVDYNEPPSVILVYAKQDTTYSEKLTFTVQVHDREGDRPTLSIGYSRDGGATYSAATLASSPAVTLEQDIFFTWMAFRDLGYSYQTPVLIRITGSDNDQGEPVIAGPFTVTDLVGDYTFDLRIDGLDLPVFINAWNKQDVSREIGPATGTVPALTVQPDKKIDFEDLAVFTMMWNWYTEQAKNLKNIRFNKPVAGTPASDIRFLLQEDGAISIRSDTRPDYLNLFIVAESENETGVSVTGSEYWMVENAGVVLTRTPERNVFEYAAGVLTVGPNRFTGPYILSTIQFTGKLDRKDVVRVLYRFRCLGEENITEGIIVLTGDSIPSSKPAEFALLQNSPNPFNPSTAISFTLPEPSPVKLSIVNVEGKLVTVLVDKTLGGGFHTCRWNASGMPSGVYFYTLRAGSHSETKKMMLLK